MVIVIIVRLSYFKVVKILGKLIFWVFGILVRFEKGIVDGKRSLICKFESKKID